MLCVALNNKGTIDAEALEGWKAEIRNVCPTTPIILVGTKSDMRADAESPISTQELERAKQDYAFSAFCETSSKEWTDHNVNKAFLKAIQCAYFFKYPGEM